jgi:DNA-binding GntR family transcriptional regulator
VLPLRERAKVCYVGAVDDPAREKPLLADEEGSLGERVYRALKVDILARRLSADEPLVEQTLAERYGVSKTPVREALRLLVHDGILRVLPRKGYMVRPMGLQDVVEVFELRRILEPALCAEAARRRTAEQVARMEESIEIERHLADPSLEEQEQSLGLHRLIVEATGNRRAMAMHRSLMEDTARLPWLMPVLRTGPDRPAVEEHARIVAAIAAGDAEAASREMSAHLEATFARDLGGFGAR